MSDAEDDYMSMTISDPSPSLPKTSLQRHQQRRRLASLHSTPKPKKQLDQEADLARETALATSTFNTSSSKGAAIMAKMGFTGSGGLGRSKDARTEPIQISVKQGRSGIGMDDARKRKIRQDMDEVCAKEKRQKVDEEGYRSRVAREREEKRKEGLWWAAMKVCERLDTEEKDAEITAGPEKKAAPRVNVLWRTLALQREQRDEDKVLRKGVLDPLSSSARYEDDEADAEDKIALGTEIEEYEDKDQDEELDEYNSLEIGERLDKVVVYLREKYHYCFWCKYRYADADMEGCPGLTEEDHD